MDSPEGFNERGQGSLNILAHSAEMPQGDAVGLNNWFRRSLQEYEFRITYHHGRNRQLLELLPAKHEY